VPGTTTQWPSTLNMGSTFDPALALEWGDAMGSEFWGKGTNIQEGPGINIARVMTNGRNFEYVSGEDPVLGSVLVAPIVTGIQKHVMSISKHYIMNSQEFDRHSVNEVVDEVTSMELYGPPFGAAAAAGTSGFMCSYNLINGVYACENEQTLKTMLKGYYNFSGFVVSDWGACHSTLDSINHGLDIEMPDGKFLAPENIRRAIAAGQLQESQVDESCRRILSSYFAVPKAMRVPGPCGGGDCINDMVKTPAHIALARKLSAMSTVLLKNQGGLLPLDTRRSYNVALIGLDAVVPYTGGSGSGSVSNASAVSPMTALKARGVDVTYCEGTDVHAAKKAAKAADVAIVFGSAHTGEGHDRLNLQLGANIDDVIPAVAAAQPNTVVVLSTPGSILTDWRASVPAILYNGMPGEQVGPALGDILFGDIAPQAKLPVTMPKKENEQGFTTSQYPGVACYDGEVPFPGKAGKHAGKMNGKCKCTNPACDVEATYSEGQIVGYRWYDKHDVEPAFAFGHGLTYGNHSLSGLKVDGRTVSFTLTRTAGVGCETPQVYLGYPTAATDPKVPLKVLRFFQKSCGATTSLSYTASDRDVSNWDVTAKQWKVTKGTYKVFVCTSSRDCPLRATLTV